MSWTKKQFIVAALEEIGLASNEYDIQPEEYESALRRLDSMMADWNARGIRLGYPLASIENSSISTDANIPDSANEAVIANLAVRLGPSFGKQVSRETKVIAKRAYNTILMRSGVLNSTERQMPSTLPIGAGHKSYRSGRGNYHPTPSSPVDAGPDSVLDYN